MGCLGLDYSDTIFRLRCTRGSWSSAGKALYDAWTAHLRHLKVRNLCRWMVAWYNEYAKTTQAAD